MFLRFFGASLHFLRKRYRYLSFRTERSVVKNLGNINMDVFEIFSPLAQQLVFA